MEAFESRTGEVDYSRYCLLACRPGADHEDLSFDGIGLLCVGVGGEDDDDDDPEDVREANAARDGSPMMALHADSDTAEKAPTKADVAETDVAQKIALGEMQRAKRQAEAAAEAAHMAEQAYQHVLTSSSQMAAAAGKATFEEIKKEAGEQAEEALIIRQRYEADAKKKATTAAVKAADVYFQAKYKALTTAAQWKARATDFAKAAKQREKMAMDLAATAEKYRIGQMWPMAKKSIYGSHQAMAQAAMFADDAQAANSEAQAIMNSGPWYDYAEQAAAANALAKAMPIDVEPPPMPQLPGLNK